MLPFVYKGDDDDSEVYDGDRRCDRYRRSRSQSRSATRSPSWSSSRSARGDRRPRRPRRSRSRTASSEREEGERSRSPRRERDRSRRRGSGSYSTRESTGYSSPPHYGSSSYSRSVYDKSGMGSSQSVGSFGQPHYKIVMKMLPADIQRDTLMSLLARQGFHVKDIRIIHKGPDRCFGFVEFHDVNNAQAWMEFNKGMLTLDDGRLVRLEYSRYDNLDGRSNNTGGAGEWMCAKCTIKNYKNRDTCFKCSVSRIESDSLTRKGYAAIGVAKCDTLLFRDIPLKCTEAAIEAALSRITSIEVLRVHIADSGLYAYVQMRSADDAERLMLSLNQIPFVIDGCLVMVTYSRLPLNTVLSTTHATESVQKATTRVSQLPSLIPTSCSAGNSGVEAAQLAIAKAALMRQMAESVVAGEIYNTPSPTLVGRQQAQEANFVVTECFKDDSQETNFVCIDEITGSRGQEVVTTSAVGVVGAATSAGVASSYSAANAASSAIDLGNVETPWGTFKRYHPPNPTLFQYEASSGLYYDPATGLYYDSNSQYYWNATTQKWNSWNGTYQAYIPCDVLSTATAETSSASATNTEQSTSAAAEPETSKATAEKKPEPAKSAKDIARSMAKWARRQEKVLLSVKTTPKLETTSPLVAMSSKPKAEPTADLTFKLLEKAKNPLGSPSDDEEEMPPPPKIAATGISRSAINSVPPAAAHANTSLQSSGVVDPVASQILKASQTDESFVSVEKKFCILCKRKFGTLEVLMKHVRMSDMHKKNLETHLLQSSIAEQASPNVLATPFSEPSSSYNTRPPQYRDRAKERRELFGLDPSGFTSEVGETDVFDYGMRSDDTPLDESNIGNKLLKSMGWTEGTGIGKNNQGIVNPIAVERRVEGAGLGATGSRVLHGANASRRERARYAAMSRYQELS